MGKWKSELKRKILGFRKKNDFKKSKSIFQRIFSTIKTLKIRFLKDFQQKWEKWKREKRGNLGLRKEKIH